MEIVNLLPQTFQVGKRIILPSGVYCRCEYSDIPESVVDEIPITTRLHGSIINLPPPDPNKMFLVDHVVRRVSPRSDLLSPGKVIKQESGIVYLESLRRV